MTKVGVLVHRPFLKGVTRIRHSAFRSPLVLIAACALQACGSSGSDDSSRAAPDSGAPPSGAASGSTAGVVAAATGLNAEIFCDPAVSRRGLAELSWTPADPPGQEQRIEVTIFKNGFETGAFEETKTLPPDQDSFLLDTVQGQAIHRWRVQTIAAGAQMSSETSRFEGPLCIDDEVLTAPDPIP